MSSTRVLVLAGGESDEHEVSISSASSLLRALQGSSINATALVIARDGRWLTSRATPSLRRITSSTRSQSSSPLLPSEAAMRCMCVNVSPAPLYTS